MSVPRHLSSNERSILDRILGFEFPGADMLRSQLHGLRAICGCECGCATIDLVVDNTHSQRAVDAPAVLPVTVTTNDGLGGLIVFCRDGWLSRLEIYSVGDDPISEFPAAESITFARNTTEPS